MSSFLEGFFCASQNLSLTRSLWQTDELKSIPFINALKNKGIIGTLRRRGFRIPLEPDIDPKDIHNLSVGDVLYIPTVSCPDIDQYAQADELPRHAKVQFIRYEISKGAKRPEMEEITPLRLLVNPGVIHKPGTIRSSSANGLLRDVSPEKVYFTADTHFFDAGVLKHRPRFASIGEMNDRLVENWNKTVPPDGIVIHLGDMMEGTGPMAEELVNRLNGTIYLIEGNHDHGLYHSSFFTRCQKVVPIGSDRMVKIGIRRIQLNHYPFLCYAGQYSGVWQLFGHVHSGREVRGFDLPRLANLLPFQYDVGIDNNDDRPISLTRLSEIMDRRRDFVYLDIRPATEFDIDEILSIFRYALGFMGAHGNTEEWDESTITTEIVRQDIEMGAGMVVLQKREIIGYFAAVPGDKADIPGGLDWNDPGAPFLWVTRIASFEETHGVFHQVFGHCCSRCGDIRLCTTEKNIPMMRALKSHYFTCVGTFRQEDGLEMVGYQRMMGNG